MDGPGLHRYAVLLAVCTLLLLMSGAAITDYDGGPKPPGFLTLGHEAAAAVVGLLTIGLAFWLSASGQPAWLKRVGWISLFVFIVDGALGTQSLLLALPKTVSVFHAFLAQLFFASTVAITVFLSPDWKRGGEPVKDQGWPSLRSLSMFALFLILLQVWLGAAFRHQAAGLMPHMAGAITVALVILILCMFVMQQFPEHRSLRPAANVLLALVLVQVVFGIAALTARMMTAENTLTMPLLLTTVAHVATGAVTLSGTVALAIQIRRNVSAAP
jgi:cytochrome c oxidase assembly protein subunit 15